MSNSALATQTPSTPTKLAQSQTLTPPLSESASRLPFTNLGKVQATPSRSKHHSTGPESQPLMHRSIPSGTGSSQLGVPGSSHAHTVPSALSLSPGTARLGSRSPSSIPSSPTSIHSSSSAIFERDIEHNPAFGAGNLPHSTNPHRIPRAKDTEATDTGVPSVLDSAISALCAEDGSSAGITVLSPAPLTAGNPSSIGSSSGTSSGSPHVMSLLLQGMGMSGLVSASASISGAASASGFASGFASPIASSRAPSPTRSISPLGPDHMGVSSSPPSTSVLSSSSPRKKPSVPAPSVNQQLPAPLPSPSMKAQNRLSFISYTDLLTNAPIASQPLSAVLSPGNIEPPTHLVVHDHSTAPGSPTGSPMTPSTAVPSQYLGIGSLNHHHGLSPEKDVDIDSLGTVGLKGGEWEREGLGSGMEERLERLWAVEKEVNAGNLPGSTRPESAFFAPPAS